MAKRYRYEFARTKEAEKGKLAIGVAAASFLLFIAAVITAALLNGKYGYIVGGIAFFAVLLAAYGFVMGLASFYEENRKHKTSIVGSLLNGIILVAWIGLFIYGMN
ncbi:MAG: hypothetical protein HUJ72_01485 [Blautia sp.]|nr:hypothetical protein [Blautia sp.]